MKTKKCGKCGIEKPLTAEYYYIKSTSTLEFQFPCKVCKTEYYQNNKEKIAKREAEWYQNNKKRITESRTQRLAEQVACVYQILNKANEKIYIGESLRGEFRWKEHMTKLRGNKHINAKLQADFNKFGEEAFEWSIIKEVDKDKPTLLLEEIRTIDSFLRQGKELYNLSLTIDQLKLLQEDK